MSKLREAAERITSSVSQNVNNSSELTDTMIELAPEVDAFLNKCGVPEDVPTNPNQNPSEAESKAWVDAWSLKSAAGKATSSHVNIIAKRLKRERRKNGQAIKLSEAKSLAQAMIETAKTHELPDIAAALLETRAG